MSQAVREERYWVLQQYGRAGSDLASFATRMIEVAKPKFNSHLYDGRVEGYGMVLYPRK